MMSMIIVMLLSAHSKIGNFSSPYDPSVHLTGRLLSLLLGMVKQGTGGWAVREEEIPGNLEIRLLCFGNFLTSSQNIVDVRSYSSF